VLNAVVLCKEEQLQLAFKTVETNRCSAEAESSRQSCRH